MLFFVIAAVCSFLVTFLSVPVLIRKFSDAGIVGSDVHKKDKPKIPEMGGLAVVCATISALLLLVAASTLIKNQPNSIPFSPPFTDLINIFAAISTMLIIALIGLFDDLVRMDQRLKAILPLFAAVPLIAVAAGNPYVTIPLFGKIYMPLLYPLVFIPLGVAVLSNLTNMFAGFNGMEAGMGLVMAAGLLPVAIHNKSPEAIAILLALSTALLAFLLYNKYPARIFIGDVGTLFIGTSVAAAAILGNFELAAVIVAIPYLLDFVIKAKNRFPSRGWWGELGDDGLLFCKGRPVGLAQLLMKKTGGIKETKVTQVFILFEALCVVVASVFYLL